MGGQRCDWVWCMSEGGGWGEGWVQCHYDEIDSVKQVLLFNRI